MTNKVKTALLTLRKHCCENNSCSSCELKELCNDNKGKTLSIQVAEVLDLYNQEKKKAV